MNKDELEKEAEEYYEDVTVGTFQECKENFADAVLTAYRDGAEFGYNKATEWHYVKDGDYPKDNKPVLCIIGDIDSDSCEVGYYNDVGSGEPWHFETYHLPDDGDNTWGVSAWKEIVFPELPEEIEQ